MGGRVNASARKITSGSVLSTSASRRSQNASGLVCGLSTRNIRTPWLIHRRTTRSTSAYSPAGSRSKFSG